MSEVNADWGSFESSVGHKMRAMDRFADPSGRLEDDDDGEAHASMVKYIARHVSAKVPDGYELCGENCAHCRCLRTSWDGRDLARYPENFRNMVNALLRHQRQDLPPELYNAAYRKEILGRACYQYLARKENQRADKVALLKGAGYNVH